MKITQFAICAVLGVASLAAYGQENSVRIGVDYINNHSDSPNLTSNGPAFLTPQPAGITVGNATTLILAYTRKLNDHWDFDFVIGIPPRVSASGTGTLAPFGVVAKVKEFGPTAFLLYNFGTAADKFRPFVGGGANFTHFSDAQSTDSGNLATGGPTKISLSNSRGWALKGGASYQLNEQWSLIGAVAALKVKSNMTTTTGSIERKTSIDFRPVIYTVGAAYHF